MEKIDSKSLFLGEIEKEIFSNVNLTKLKRESGKSEKELIGDPYFAKPFSEKDSFIFIRRDPHLKRYYIKRYYLIEPPADLKSWVASKIKPRLFIKPLRGNRLVAFADVNGEFATHHHMISITFKDFGYSYKFAEAIINSPIPSFWLQKTIFGDSTETARELNKPYMRKIPIPIIYFVTPKDELEADLKHLKELYQQEDKNIMEKIEALLAKDWQPDAKKVEVHNSKKIYEDFQIPVGEKWLRNDVVHDFLAYLAEQMSKFANNKYLLGLYSSGKLKKESIEDANSKEYNKKNARFLARMYEKKFDDTDKLIDGIVYRLFGLTEEEMKIVEGK